jgi:hypothetical protein
MIVRDASYTRNLKSTADAFRLGMEGLASEDLRKVIDLLVPLVQDPAWSNRENTNRIFGELLEAQSRKDYLRAADLLEYEISKWFINYEKGNVTHGK